MKILTSTILLYVSLTTCNLHAQRMEENLANKIADKIYIIEGANKTKYPYGIRSIKTNNPRQVCINTIQNNYTRWKKASQGKEYLDYLADKYCPSSVDKQGNLNWKKNIQFSMKGTIIK